jgi:hypothetical protein
MTTQTKKRAAARSAARMKKEDLRKEPSPDPRSQVKKSPRGTLYRVTTVSLDDLPGFLERNQFVAKTFFHYKPEEDPTIPEKTPEDRYRKYLSGFVLGVRKRGETEVREL